MTTSAKGFFLSLLVLFSAALAAQEQTVVLAPEPSYEAGFIKRFWLGAHWRDLWTTPMTVKVLNLHTFAGGLSPIKRGGGLQTKSLRLKGNDGKEYKFRSMKKDPKNTLPRDLQETLAADLLQDQISSSNPVAPLVVAALLNATGVLNSEPDFYIILDSLALGSYKQDFFNVLGTLEENPNSASDDEEGFGGADKVKGTYKFFHKLEADNDHQPDAAEFLKARLMDIFIGDWDRHTDQWRWASFKVDKQTLWKPIPRDRDQAFARLDGVLPFVGTQLIPQIKHFSDDYPPIVFATWSGRFLDRRLLYPLDKAAWDSLAERLIANLSDSVIIQSVKKMPSEMFQKEGAELIATLIARRNRLKRISDDFYRLLAEDADIYASDKQEFLDIQRIDERRLSVKLYKRDKETGEPKKKPFFERTFLDTETKEVRVYLMGGNDSAVIQGSGSSNTLVRIVGGAGRDVFLDQSKVGGGIFTSRKIAYFYDSDSDLHCESGSHSLLKTDAWKTPTADVQKYENVPRDYGSQWWFDMYANFASEYGFLYEYIPQFYEYGFRAEPYLSRMEFRIGYAIGANRPIFEVNWHLPTLLSFGEFKLQARASGIDVLRFYGLGNETKRLDSLAKVDFYRAPQVQFSLSPRLEFPFTPTFRAFAGASAKFVTTTQEDEATFLSVERAGGRTYYGTTDLGLVSFTAGASYDSRNNLKAASRGILLEAQASHFPKLWKNQFAFTKLRFDSRLFLSVDFPKHTTLALRAGGEKIWGQFPFFEAAFLGGKRNVRGYDLQRFAGDGALRASSELRTVVSTYNFIMPTTLGVLVFAESGRVFLEGESSTLWHSGLGFGWWFSFINPDLTVSFSFGFSREQAGFYISGGFTF